MITEFGIWAGTSILLHHYLFKKPSDKQKIEETFQNTNFGFKDKLPSRAWTHKKDNYTVYAYNLPAGLTDNPKLEYILEKTLNKPVRIEMDHQLKIYVYKEGLKTKYDYHFFETQAWTVPIGYDLDGVVQHNFDKIPHATVAGMTRQGKTVLLKLLMAHLIYNHPNDVEFYIIDLKGGLEFGRYRNLKQVKQVASNIDETYKLLKNINKKIKSDIKEFKQSNYSNILDTNINKRTFVITDEAAELTPAKHHSKTEKEMFGYCQSALSEICRIAAALGYRNIFCTQYPTADTLPRQIKQNSDAKISFRLPTEVASRVAIDEQGAEELEVPGRAIYRTHDRKEIQVPFISDNNIKQELGGYEVERIDQTEDKQAGNDLVEFG